MIQSQKARKALWEIWTRTMYQPVFIHCTPIHIKNDTLFRIFTFVANYGVNSHPDLISSNKQKTTSIKMTYQKIVQQLCKYLIIIINIYDTTFDKTALFIITKWNSKETSLVQLKTKRSLVESHHFRLSHRAVENFKTKVCDSAFVILIEICCKSQKWTTCITDFN